MQVIENKNFPFERDLYGANGIHLKNCTFTGEEDGESALKESKDIVLENCYMNLRYPLWHDDVVTLNNVTMTDKCRASLWYTNNLKIKDSNMLGIKAVRECNDIIIENTKIISPEFGWKSHKIDMNNCDIESEYLFLLASDIKLNDVRFRGKYSFQYVENMQIENSTLDTKDAFWHTKNVTVKNSTIKGEYLAWYSENLTLINCKIIGTQPLCYCKGLKLINCEMIETDLSFEYSEVDAEVKGEILSVKNVKSGKIVCGSVGEVIITEDSKIKPNCEIIQTSKVSK